MKKEYCWYIGNGNQCIPESAIMVRKNDNGIWQYKKNSKEDWNNAPMLGEDMDTKYIVPYYNKNIITDYSKVLTIGIVLFVIGVIAFILINVLGGYSFENIVSLLVVSDWIIAIMFYLIVSYAIFYSIYKLANRK